MKKKFILMFVIFSILNCYSQSDKEQNNSRTGNDSQLYYNPQIGNGGYNDMKEKLRTIESNNTKADACLKSGNDFVKSKKYEEAIAEYTKAIEINNNFSAAYFNRGLVEVVLGLKERGCLDLNKAEELGEKSASKMTQKYCK
jgi:tetratricopeptide (TPR) repeat protein